MVPLQGGAIVGGFKSLRACLQRNCDFDSHAVQFSITHTCKKPICKNKMLVLAHSLGVVQAGLELWSFFLSLLSAGITVMYHHAQSVCFLV